MTVQPYVRRFIRSSLVWLAVGVSLGVLMALSPRAILYRPAHMHANLLGFVSMMIFGVAYHVIPRFTAAPLHSHRLALWRTLDAAPEPPEELVTMVRRSAGRVR